MIDVSLFTYLPIYLFTYLPVYLSTDIIGEVNNGT